MQRVSARKRERETRQDKVDRGVDVASAAALHPKQSGRSVGRAGAGPGHPLCHQASTSKAVKQQQDTQRAAAAAAERERERERL